MADEPSSRPLRTFFHAHLEHAKPIEQIERLRFQPVDLSNDQTRGVAMSGAEVDRLLVAGPSWFVRKDYAHANYLIGRQFSRPT